MCWVNDNAMWNWECRAEGREIIISFIVFWSIFQYKLYFWQHSVPKRTYFTIPVYIIFIKVNLLYHCSIHYIYLKRTPRSFNFNRQALDDSKRWSVRPEAPSFFLFSKSFSNFLQHIFYKLCDVLSLMSHSIGKISPIFDWRPTIASWGCTSKPQIMNDLPTR